MHVEVPSASCKYHWIWNTLFDLVYCAPTTARERGERRGWGSRGRGDMDRKARVYEEGTRAELGMSPGTPGSCESQARDVVGLAGQAEWLAFSPGGTTEVGSAEPV